MINKKIYWVKEKEGRSKEIYIESKPKGAKRFQNIKKINWDEIEKEIEKATKNGYDARLRDIDTNLKSPIYKARSKT